MLDFLVPEAHQRLQGDLITKPMLTAHVEYLGRDEALDQAEHVGVSPTLDLTQQTLVVRVEELQAVDLRQPVGQEFLREVELPLADHVAIDVPPDALRYLD